MLEFIQSFSNLTWVLTVILGFFTWFIVKHILKVRSWPPGPFPLPLLGNILEFRGKDTYPKDVFQKLCRQYKDIFTLWLGAAPTVIVCSWELCREGLVVKRNDFSGRIKRLSSHLYLEGDEGVVLGDFSPCWESIRKVLTSAVRKYSMSEKLADLVSDVVDRASDQMVKVGKPVDAYNYAYLIVFNIVTSSTFGQRFEMDDPELLALKKTNDELTEFFTTGLPSDFAPFLRWFYREKEQLFTRIMKDVKGYIGKKFNEHKATYQKGTIRDFTDAVLAARQEAEEEDKDSLEHLTDGNMRMILADLYIAGIDSTRSAIVWLVLFVCQDPDIQKRIQAELDGNIGARPPCQNDRTSCPYIYSVITEVLRVRPAVDFTLEHRATCDTQLGGYKIPKDTGVLFSIREPQNNEAFWEEPQKFKPERFLDADGKFNQTRLTGFLPFGLGRRGCPGEKLAYADIFLIVSRLFQKYSFELENGIGSVSLEPKPDGVQNHARPYNLIIMKRPNIS